MFAKKSRTERYTIETHKYGYGVGKNLTTPSGVVVYLVWGQKYKIRAYHGWYIFLGLTLNLFQYEKRAAQSLNSNGLWLNCIPKIKNSANNKLI